MKKVYLLFTVLIFLILNVQGQVTGDFRSLASGSGNWNDFTSWEMYDGTNWLPATSGQLPTATSAVEIQAGFTMTINAPLITPGTSGNLTVNGALTYLASTASALTVSGTVTVNGTGSFTSPASGTVVTHALNISGDLTVNGIFNMNAFSTAGVVTTFTGATNNVINGTGSTINFYSLTVNKGTAYTNILEVNSVITIAPPASAGIRLTITNGTFKLSSASTLTPYYGGNNILSATGRLWLNNAGAVVSSVGAGTPVGAGRLMVPGGRLQITAGTFSYGSGGDVHSFGNSGPYLTLEGPNATMNIYGALQIGYSTNFTMSAGNLNIYPQVSGSPAAGYASLAMESYFLVPTNYSLTGGTITIVDPPSTTSYPALNCSLSNGTFNLSGVTIRFGDGTSDKAGTANGFLVNANVPIGYVVVNNNTASVLTTRVVKMNGAFTVGSQLTINNGTANQFLLNGFSMTIAGNITNSGTFTGDGSAGNGIVFNGTTQQIVSGPGTFTNSNINNITVNNTSGASPAVDIQIPLSVSNGLTLTNGTLGTSNASTFTIGRSASSTTFSMTRSGGSIALTPTFALGGVSTINFSYTAPNPAASVTTGVELPPVTNLNSFTVNNASGVILDKAVSATTLALTAGILTTTSTNSMTVLGTTVASITGGSATAYVSGPLTRTLPNTASSANYKFPIGKTAYHLFEFETITTGGTGTAAFTAEVFDVGPYSASAGTGMATINTDKYWALQGTLGSVTITSSKIRITEAGLTSVNKIGQSNTSSGSYNNVGGILGTGTISTNKVIDYSALSTGTNFRIGTAGSLAAGTYAIGPGGPYGGYAGTYATVQNAIDGVTDVTLGGNVIFEIQPDYVPSVEIFPLNLTTYLGASGSATATFRPASSVSAIINFTAGGTVLSNVGADYILFDGRPGGAGTSRFLQFTNTTTTGSAVTLTGDAQYNQFLYCVLKGSTTTASTGVLTINAPTAGNNYYTIDHCNIDGSGSANNGIYSTGLANFATITNNNFYDYRNGGGVYLLSGSDAAVISGNNFYQTSSYNGFAGTTYGIYISGNFNTYQVFNNIIGGSGPGGTGTWTVSATTPAAYNFTGIYLNAGITVLSKIYNNQVRNFDWKSTPAVFTGINVPAGIVNVGTDGANIIGSNTGNDNIKVTYYTTNAAATVYGISVAGTTTRVENNNIGSITTLLSGVTGVGSSIIGINATTPTCVIRNNVIGSTSTALSINAANQSTTGNIQNVYGINTSSVTSITINKNTIANLYNGMTFASASAGFLRGIKLSGGATAVVDSNLICTFTTPQPMTGSGISTYNIIGIDFNNTGSTSTTIMGNTIYELTNTSSTGAVGVIGLYFHGSSGASNKIDKNLIHSFVTSSATAIQTGFLMDIGTVNFQNNVIRLGIDKAGLPITSTAQINGISKTGGSLNCYFNTIFIGGSGVSAGTVNTYAFSQTVHGTEDIRDNIFMNVRTNAVANKLNYALNYPAGMTTNFTADYNIYTISSTDAKLAKVGTVDQTNIGALQAALPGSDLHSAFGDPLLTSPGTDITTMSLVPLNTSPAEGQGVAVTAVTDDFNTNLRSGLTPTDIGAYAGNFTPPGAGQDIWYPVISYIPLLNTGLTTNRTTVNFATITDNFTGVNTTAGTKPRLYFKKSTDANAYNGNTSADNGWKWVEANNTTSPFDFTIDYSIIFGGSVSIGDSIRYFVVAQDLATIPNVSFNPSNGASGTSVAPSGMTFPAVPGSYAITPTIASAVDVGTGYTYTTLTGTLASGGLFAAINAGVINSNVVATIRTDIVEPGTVGLNLITEEGPNAGTLSLTIQSDGVAHLVSGSVGAASPITPMIPVNGARRVTFDGGAGKFLTFRNTYASIGYTGPVIMFNYGSQNCVVTRCIIESNAYDYLKGEVNVGSSGINSVTISNNDFREARGGSPLGSVKAAIVSGSSNNSLTITNNNIYNWKSSFNYEVAFGIYLPAVANGCIITGNSLYMESGMNPVCGETAIYVGSGNNHNISGNYIGGSGPACAGTWTGSQTLGQGTTGIYLVNGTSVASTIQGNTIQNFNVTGNPFFIGIENASGVANIVGNTIGSATVANSIQMATTSAIYPCIGIYNLTPTGACNLDQNIIANITFTGTSGTMIFKGIQTSGGNTRKNRIFNIGITATALVPSIYGISNASGLASNEFSNNMISLNGGAAGNPSLFGFYDASSVAGTTGFYFNSIYLYGTATGTAVTYAYYRTGTAGYVLSNNILDNMRTGTGTHYAIYVTTASSFTSNYNDILTSGASFGYYGTAKASFALWQAIPMDLNSFNVDPVFVSGTDLHASAPQLNNGGVVIAGITDDLSNIARTNPPDIGAYEFTLPITSINTLGATAILGSSATLHGNINTDNELVTMSFEYGLTNAYGSVATGIPTQVRSLASVLDSAFISSLSPNTLYHYRIVGTSATSTEIIYGSDMTFTTSGGVAGLWTGMTSTDWATASNWDNQVLPTSLNDVVIPASAVNWPVFTGTITLGTTCNSITLAGAASQLTVTFDMVIPTGFTVTNNGTIHLLTH